MALKFRKSHLPAIDDYELLEKIGEGAVGSVYKASHRPTGETVAIKIIKADLANQSKLLKRFEKEFRAARTLVHPNIVRVLEFGQDGSTAYLVMEFVDGRSLGEHVEREGRLPEGEAICIITQVAQALHYAHKHGMIHRDVKPDNILLRRDGKAELGDFGVVKDLADNLKLTGPLSVLGTPHFMAPEQYTDPTRVDQRCDVYSLAATLYLAVTGQLPFQAPTSLATLKKQATNDFIPPRKLVPSLSQHIDKAIRRAMSLNPADRPPSCLAFVKDLKVANERRSSLEAPGTIRACRSQVSPAEGTGAERRAHVRFPCALETACSVESSLHPGDAGEEDTWLATVQDISRGGIALILARRFERGTLLSVELHRTGHNRPRPFTVRVMRVKAQTYGRWLVGCAFEGQLSNDELKGLL